MFTGIIEETGTIKAVSHHGSGIKITIAAQKILNDLQVDHSIAVNGVCLTAVAVDKCSFSADAVEETLSKTSLARVKVGDVVNLERALRLQDRLGGHLVQGHVDGIARIIQYEKSVDRNVLIIEIPESISKYTISKGSITIDGISLTIAEKNSNRLKIAVIPHTINNTNLKYRETGDLVNIEVDLIAKYVEQMLTRPEKGTITEQWLKEQGF